MPASFDIFDSGVTRMLLPRPTCLGVAWVLLLAAEAPGQAPLPQRIDQEIQKGIQGTPAATRAGDAEFLRRIYLDLTGIIPAAAEVRAFISDPAPDKRAKLIDKLLAGE